jgi:hypothetical protein
MLKVIYTTPIAYVRVSNCAWVVVGTDKSFAKNGWRMPKAVRQKRDRQYVVFHERISRGGNGAQIIRYTASYPLVFVCLCEVLAYRCLLANRYDRSEGSIPLWVQSKAQLNKADLATTLKCSCGAPRRFEFQVTFTVCQFHAQHADHSII